MKMELEGGKRERKRERIEIGMKDMDMAALTLSQASQRETVETFSSSPPLTTAANSSPEVSFENYNLSFISIYIYIYKN